MIADTSFIIDLMRSDQRTIRKAQILTQERIPISVSAVTIFEVFVGISLSIRQGEEKRRVINVIEGLPIIPLEMESSEEAGKIYAERRRSGITMDPEDAMIAGICKFKKEPVLTRNTKHFSGIDGVEVENY